MSITSIVLPIYMFYLDFIIHYCHRFVNINIWFCAYFIQIAVIWNLYTPFFKNSVKKVQIFNYIFRTISNLALFFIFYRIVTTKRHRKSVPLFVVYYLLSLSSRALSSSYIIAGTRSPTYFVLLNLGFSFAFELLVFSFGLFSWLLICCHS